MATLPTLHQKRFQSYSAFAEAEASDTSETTPATVTPAIADFTASLGGDDARFIPVVEDPRGMYGFCSDGVTEKVRWDGGAIVYGWCVWEWPEALVTAEFHAVWQDPNGVLLDITPKPKGEAQVLFVPDYTYPADFNFDNRPLNRRARLHRGPDRVEQAKFFISNLSGSKLAYEQKRAEKAGLALDEAVLRKMPHDAVEQAIDNMISLANEFDAHFDTLGTSGMIEPDTKLMNLMKRRFDSQQIFKSLWGRR